MNRGSILTRSPTKPSKVFEVHLMINIKGLATLQDTIKVSNVGTEMTKESRVTKGVPSDYMMWSTKLQTNVDEPLIWIYGRHIKNSREVIESTNTFMQVILGRNVIIGEVMKGCAFPATEFMSEIRIPEVWMEFLY